MAMMTHTSLSVVGKSAVCSPLSAADSAVCHHAQLRRDQNSSLRQTYTVQQGILSVGQLRRGQSEFKSQARQTHTVQQGNRAAAQQHSECRRRLAGSSQSAVSAILADERGLQLLLLLL